MENPIKMDDLGGKPSIFGNTHMFQVKLRLPLWNICQKPNAFDSMKHPEASHGGALLHIKAQDLKEVMVQITTKVQWELYALIFL